MTGRAALGVWSATGSEVAWHYAVRHRVFVEEQGVLVLTDLDRFDRTPGVHHVVGAIGDEVAGSVRLFPTGDGRWHGDRLAVLPGHRTSHLGAQLVRYAVATAAAAGGIEMDAQIQPTNVAFFEHLGWRRDGPVQPYLGIDHQPMLIDLRTVPPARCGGRPNTPRLGDVRATIPSCLIEPVVGASVSEPSPVGVSGPPAA